MGRARSSSVGLGWAGFGSVVGVMTCVSVHSIKHFTHLHNKVSPEYVLLTMKSFSRSPYPSTGRRYTSWLWAHPAAIYILCSLSFWVVYNFTYKYVCTAALNIGAPRGASGSASVLAAPTYSLKQARCHTNTLYTGLWLLISSLAERCPTRGPRPISRSHSTVRAHCWNHQLGT